MKFEIQIQYQRHLGRAATVVWAIWRRPEEYKESTGSGRGRKDDDVNSKENCFCASPLSSGVLLAGAGGGGGRGGCGKNMK